MPKKKDGGAAFPIVINDDVIAIGLTKRQYYAAMAMQGRLASGTAESNRHSGKLAEWSFFDADAMIAFEEKDG